MLKKLVMILLLLSVHLAEQVSALDMRIGGATIHIEHICALILSFNEFVSIIENCAHAGAPIPEVLVARLLRFKRLLRFASQQEIDDLKKNG